ncbi:MAG: hypothetical protein Q9220_007487 [cf. Caloplaca sp. 1 TL-2023]
MAHNVSYSRTYTVEEVFDLKVQDFQDPKAYADYITLNSIANVAISGWPDLSPEIQEQCIAKFRDLVNQRKGSVRSEAVNPFDLQERLNQIQDSGSPTPPLSPYDPDKPEELEKDWKIETVSHEALVAERGRPCYPIALGLNIFNNPGQYKDIIDYWEEGHHGLHESRQVFTRQVRRWRRFQDFQQRNRDYFVPRGQLSRYQDKVLERRRRHSLHGEPQLLEEQSKQTELDNWMEYQNWELGLNEKLERALQDKREQVASWRKSLFESGLSVEEGVEELQLGAFLGLINECDAESAPFNQKEQMSEHKLRLLQARLKVAQSSGLSEEVKQAAWERPFSEEVESIQARTEKLHCLAKIAKNELDPLTEWYYSSRGEQKSAEHEEKFKRYKDQSRHNHDARMAHFCAKKDLDFAKEVLDVARLDIRRAVSKGVFKKTALIANLEEDIRTTTEEHEEAKEMREKYDLKRKVIGGLAGTFTARTEFDRHKLLVEWVEEQRCEILSAQERKETDQFHTQDKHVTSTLPRKEHAERVASINGPLNSVRNRRGAAEQKSILSPLGTAKVSKTSSKKRKSPRPKTDSIPRKALDEVPRPAAKSLISNPTKRNVSPMAKKTNPDALTTVKSARVSKQGRGRPPKSITAKTTLTPKKGRPRRKQEGDLLAPSLTRVSRKNAAVHDTDVQPRRSSRVSKPPDRFRPA